ncbi:MAG: autotransporter outer membrane beta-barrel domain-containing protein, partial [Planctomycetaceae bacterium]|nr:autotransporter outer membrane beta-barrel domain-containing protein [Planctomycetaceae bacterium]
AANTPFNLTWTGKGVDAQGNTIVDNEWTKDSAKSNWYGSISGTTITVESFLDYDTVYFRDSYTDGAGLHTLAPAEKLVKVMADVQVQGMRVRGSGFTFDLTQGEIRDTGKEDTSNPADPRHHMDIDFGDATIVTAMPAPRLMSVTFPLDHRFSIDAVHQAVSESGTIDIVDVTQLTLNDQYTDASGNRKNYFHDLNDFGDFPIKPGGEIRLAVFDANIVRDSDNTGGTFKKWEADDDRLDFTRDPFITARWEVARGGQYGQQGILRLFRYTFYEHYWDGNTHSAADGLEKLRTYFAEVQSIYSGQTPPTSQEIEALLTADKYLDFFGWAIRKDQRALNIIDEVRGPEIAADAVMMTLWKPWERTSHRFNFGGDTFGETRDINRLETWGEIYHRTGDADSDANAADYKETRSGVMLGADWGDNRSWCFGGVLGYGTPKITHHLGNMETEDFTAGVYSGVLLHSFFLHSFFGYGQQFYSMTRTGESGIYTSGIPARYTSDYNGHAWYASLELSRPIGRINRFGCSAGLIPLVAVDWQQAKTGGFTETGTGVLTQNVDRTRVDQCWVRTGLDGFVDMHILRAFSRLRIASLAGGDDTAAVRSTFTAAPVPVPTPVAPPPMEFRSVKLGRTYVNAGLTLSGNLRWLDAFAGLDYYWMKRYNSYQMEGGLLKKW